jgi:hypothetical protein
MPRTGPRLSRSLRRFAIHSVRAVEAGTLLLGRLPWKIERFNRMIDADIRAAVSSVGSAQAIVGIPFHKESDNIVELVRKTLDELESRAQNAAIVIIGERKTRDLLLHAALPPSTARVRIVCFTKPFGFGQKPGLSRRSWSHWAILQLANRLRCDVVFIDADVRNSEGWVTRYLEAIQQRGADVAVANYLRDFARDDALVHVWDRLIFGALFKKWIAFRHGGDYGVSRKILPEILSPPSIMRERTYTMDSAVIARVAQRGGKIESVWLGSKLHEPISPQALFRRLPDLVRSVFDDVAAHLRVLLVLSRNKQIPDSLVTRAEPVPMQTLIGDDFRRELYRDAQMRFHSNSAAIESALGSAALARYRHALDPALAENVTFAPQPWATATRRFLTRYLKARDDAKRNTLSKAYVPVLEIGILAFLNRVYHLTYTDAAKLLDNEYVPAFEQTWNALARRLVVYRIFLSRNWPLRLANKLGTILRRFHPAQSGG